MYCRFTFDINVVVGDSPTGPFRDEIGKPLIEGWRNTNNIKEGLDPGVFIDDDGTGYLTYGYTNRGAGIIQLGDDLMISEKIKVILKNLTLPLMDTSRNLMNGALQNSNS